MLSWYYTSKTREGTKNLEVDTFLFLFLRNRTSVEANACYFHQNNLRIGPENMSHDNIAQKIRQAQIMFPKHRVEYNSELDPIEK